MDLKKLRYAVTLARHLNFTKAADALNITQSALSRSIQALEDECQLRLFDRNRNAVAITATGREFIGHATSLLRQEAELVDMVSHASRGDGGSVALGMAPLASRTLLSPVMTELIGRSGFHATVTIGAPKKLLSMLLNESVQLCVCTGRDLAPNGLFASVRLARLSISVVVRPGHPLTRHASVTPADLDPYPLLRTRSSELDDDEPGGSDASLLRTPVLAIEDYDVLMKITSSSDAVWVTAPIGAREWIAQGRLAQIPIAWGSETPHAQMTAYYLKKRTLSPTAARILDRLVALSQEIFDPALSPG